MRALPGQRIEIERRGGDERLAFARLHLRDVTLVQGHRAHQLHVEMTLAQRPSRRLADDGERFRQDVVERLALGETVPEL